MGKTFGYLVLENKLRKYGGWPSNEGLRGTSCFIFLGILFVPATIPFYINIQRIGSPKYADMVLQQVTFLLGSLQFSYIHGLFLYRQAEYMEMIQKLSEFKYGVPNGLRRVDKFVSRGLNFYNWFLYIGIFLASRAALFNSTCDEWHGIIVICEVLVPWYTPFKLNTLELTILTLFHDCCIFRMMIVSFSTLFLGYYSVEMILIRFDDLKEKIEDIKFIRNQRCSKEFQYIMVYHQDIVRLFRTCVGVNTDLLISVKIAVNSTIIICAIRFVLKRDIQSALIFFLPVAAIFILHHLGQRVIDASAAIGAAIYNLNWCDASVTLQKDVLIFMGATFEPLKLKHKILGVVSRADMKQEFTKFYCWFNSILSFISK